MKKDALVFGNFRYWLSRSWGPEVNRPLFVMLNPSTADATLDDATIRKCIGFTLRWEYTAFDVVNLYAFRTLSPKILKSSGFPVGAQNDHYIKYFARHASVIVAAWGSYATPERVEEVKRLLVDYELLCFGKTANGNPKHPLMLSYLAPLEVF